jgi:hypothetical protein
MIDFNNYLLKYHPDFQPLTGMKSTQITANQVLDYRQYMTLLCHQDTFIVQGRDSLPFLQGQLCGDVRQLSPEQALWTAHCTPKGRIFATLLLVKQSDRICAISPSSNSPDLVDRLRKYILFSKLTILPSEKKNHLFEIAGADSEIALQDCFPRLPQSPMTTAQYEELQIIRLHGKQPRWLILAMTDDSAIFVWEKLIKTHHPIGLKAHQRQLIEAGLVDVGKELQEAFLPQMIGLNQIGAMSLKKGCYVGQEVIARTSNLGKLKRQLYRAELLGNPSPSIGSDILDTVGNVVGTCVNSSYNEGTKETSILAVITEQGLENNLYCAGTQLQLITQSHPNR